MGQFLAGLQINRGARRDVLLSQVSRSVLRSLVFTDEPCEVVIATVTCPMRFNFYPFDSHTCPILFGSYTWDYNYLTFYIDNTFLTKYVTNGKIKVFVSYCTDYCLCFRVYEQNTNLDYDITVRDASHRDYHNYRDRARR